MTPSCREGEIGTLYSRELVPPSVEVRVWCLKWGRGLPTYLVFLLQFVEDSGIDFGRSSGTLCDDRRKEKELEKRRKQHNATHVCVRQCVK
jgi:hypothetical protein